MILRGSDLIGARMPDAQPVQQPQNGGSSLMVGFLCAFIGFFVGVAVGAKACMR